MSPGVECSMISPELERLLQPLERYEAIRRRVVRLGDRLCDLSYANPYAGAQQQVRAAIQDALEDQRLLDLQYSPFGGQTLARRAVADALRGSHELPFAFSDVILTPGAMSALHLALLASGREGGEVVFPVPCWLDYPLYIRATGLVPVPVPLMPGTFELDVAAVSRAVSERTCAVLLSHPANPTGRNYTPADLSAVAAAIRQSEERLGCEVTLIADETHRDYTENGEHHSAVRFWDRTFVVYSFGKYHFVQGQRLGYVATSPRHPARTAISAEMERWTRITGMATPTALMQRAIPRLLVLRHDLTWVAQSRQRLVQQLSLDGYTVVKPDATLFIYVQTPPGYDDFDFVSELAAEGVLVLPAPVFHHTGHFRLSLTGSEEMLEAALPVLKRFAPA
jgi:aspartate aminotransferase